MIESSTQGRKFTLNGCDAVGISVAGHYMLVCGFHDKLPLGGIFEASDDMVDVGKVGIYADVVGIGDEDIVVTTLHHDLAGLRPYRIEVARRNRFTVDGRPFRPAEE